LHYYNCIIRLKGCDVQKKLARQRVKTDGPLSFQQVWIPNENGEADDRIEEKLPRNAFITRSWCRRYTVNSNNQMNLIRSSSVNSVVVLTMDEQVKSTNCTVKLS